MTKATHRHHRRGSNVHYPTDSSLLGDGIRVLSRSLQRIARDCKHGAVEVVHHARAVRHRLLEISRAAKCLTEANQQRMRDIKGCGKTPVLQFGG